jgi:hypothetical protein
MARAAIRLERSMISMRNLPQRRLPALQIAHENAEDSSATIVPVCEADATHRHALDVAGSRNSRSTSLTSCPGAAGFGTTIPDRHASWTCV